MLKKIIEIIIAIFLPPSIVIGGALAVMSLLSPVTEVSSEMAIGITILVVLSVVGAFKLKQIGIRKIKEEVPEWIIGIIFFILFLIVSLSFIAIIDLLYNGIKLALRTYTQLGKIIIAIQSIIVAGVILLIWLYKKNWKKE